MENWSTSGHQVSYFPTTLVLEEEPETDKEEEKYQDSLRREGIRKA